MSRAELVGPNLSSLQVLLLENTNCGVMAQAVFSPAVRYAALAALHMASANGHQGIVIFLLQAGAVSYPCATILSFPVLLRSSALIILAVVMKLQVCLLCLLTQQDQPSEPHLLLRA